MAYVCLRDGDGLWVEGSAPLVRAALLGEFFVVAGRVQLVSPEGEELWLAREAVAGVFEEVEA